MTTHKKIMTRLKDMLPITRSLAKDEKGVAAIEFAFIAPLMIGFYFGMTEIALGITADRNVAHATSVAGDLTTQVASINTSDMADIMTATAAVLGVQPENMSRITIELNSYQKENDGTNVRVGYARLGPAISKGPAVYDPAVLNTQMLNAQSGVVVARINYRYEPVTAAFMKDVVLNETFVMKPRRSITVPFDQGGSDEFTCIPTSTGLVECTAV